jgi:hypothetical protein
VETPAGDPPALLAPVRDGGGQVVAVLGLTAESSGRLYRFGPALVAAAREIGRTVPVPARYATAPVPPAGSGVLARGIGLLGCLRPGEREVRRLDVVERVTTPRSTVYRCIDDLLRGGVLEPNESLLGLGPLVRRLAPMAVAPRLAPDDRLRGLAAAGGVACWLTPVDPDLGVPLNGLVVRGGDPGTVTSRLREWALVSEAASAAARRRRPRMTAASGGGLYATTVPLPRDGMVTCLTVVAGAARRPIAERMLRELLPSAVEKRSGTNDSGEGGREDRQ